METNVEANEREGEYIIEEIAKKLKLIKPQGMIRRLEV